MAAGLACGRDSYADGPIAGLHLLRVRVGGGVRVRVRVLSLAFTSTTHVPSALIPHEVRALVRVRVKLRDKVRVGARVNKGVDPVRGARLRVLRVAGHWVGNRRRMACRKQAGWLFSGPGRAPGCPELRSASANQPVGPHECWSARHQACFLHSRVPLIQCVEATSWQSAPCCPSPSGGLET